MVSNTTCHERDSNSQLTDFVGSCKSNYHTITTTTATIVISKIINHVSATNIEKHIKMPDNTCTIIPTTNYKPDNTCTIIPTTNYKPDNTCTIIPTTNYKPDNTCTIIPTTNYKPDNTCTIIPTTNYKPDNTCTIIPTTNYIYLHSQE